MEHCYEGLIATYVAPTITAWEPFYRPGGTVTKDRCIGEPLPSLCKVNLHGEVNDDADYP